MSSDTAKSRIAKALPILGWARAYSRATLTADLLAAVIVTIMLIPQSLAYAMLAGLPPEAGLYASILPLVAYTVFGTSRTLAVGPVAVVSLMTASAVGAVAEQGTPEYLAGATLLALMSGVMLLAMGLFRLGLIATFLSHPVISGFVTASGILIAASQLKHILGVTTSGDTLFDLVGALFAQLGEVNLITLTIGTAAIVFLVWSRRRLKAGLVGRGWDPRRADVAVKAAPVVAVAVTTFLAWGFGLADAGVRIVGDIPRGLPPFGAPPLSIGLMRELAMPALLISLVGFVESVSVAQTFAARRRQRIDPDQELVGLGAANLASSFSGGLPVTGGFSRSVVNYDAGAETPAAGAYTALGILVAVLTLTPFLYYLPQATLAATIIVAVLSLVDLPALGRTFVYSKSDFAAMAGTVIVTLGAGVEAGLIVGVSLSLGQHVWRTSRPHCAEVGLVPGTEHFRNVDRHTVRTSPRVVTLRVDESLYFPNARFLEDRIGRLVADNPAAEHIVLMCPAVNHIDASALESLETINRTLKDAGITFHLSEVKGPVMDRLKRSHFLEELTGQVFLSQYDAIKSLDPGLIVRAAE